MARSRLTIDDARSMEFQALIEASDALLVPYEAPGEGEMEVPEAKLERLSRTIDETPDIYRWFLTLESYFDHWTDYYASQGRGKDNLDYKSMRERRDAMERMASAAKRRWEGASRLITVITGFDESGMPRARGGNDGGH